MDYYKNLSLEPLFYINDEGLVCQEEFRDVPGYKGMYQVSDLGRVKSLKFNKQKILKQGLSRNYLTNAFCLNKKQKSFKAHQLVAMAFLNYIPDGTTKIVVDHIDNNPINNCLSNLQLITHRENTSKDRKNKSSKYTGVYFDSKTRKWISTIKNNRKKINLGYFENEKEASEYYQNALKSIEECTEIKVKRKNKTSIFKGVHFCNTKKRWKASIKIKNKVKCLGSFKTEIEASNCFQNFNKKAL